MSAYTSPIIKIGMITPILFLSVVVGAVFYGLSTIKAKRDQKEKIYSEYQDRIKTIAALEGKLKPNRERQTKLEQMLKAEIKPAFSKQLSDNMSRYVDKDYELQQVSLKQTEDRGAVGNNVAANLSRVQMIFRGGFGPMQEVLLDMEAQFPQLQMDRLSISRTKGIGLDQREALTFNVDYTAWKW